MEGTPWPNKPAPPEVPADLLADFTRLEVEAAAKGLLIKPTWAGEKVGFFVFDLAWDLHVRAPMYGSDLGVVAELIGEYHGEGVKGTGPGPQGSQREAVQPREVPDSQGPGGTPGSGISSGPSPA